MELLLLGRWKATTSVAIGTYNTSSHDYRVYVGATDSSNNGRVYCLAVTYDSGANSFFVTSEPWTYDLDGAPIDSPVLGIAGNLEAVYICDTGGRLHCIKESNGSRLWRSVQLVSGSDVATLKPPLYTETNHNGSDAVGYRVYVASVATGDPGKLFAFETSYAGPENSQSPVWTATLTNTKSRGNFAGTPTRGTSAVVSPDTGQGPILYLTRTTGCLEKFYDLGTTYDEQSFVTGFGTDLGCYVYPLVVSDGTNDRIYYVTYHVSAGTLFFGLDNEFDYLWTGMDVPYVTEISDNHVPPDSGHLGGPLGQPCSCACTDKGAQPTLYFPATHYESFNGKACLDRITDLSPGSASATANITVEMTSTTELGTNAGFIVRQNGQNTIYYLTQAGKFYICGTTGGPAYGWPKTLSLSGAHIYGQTIAVDADGAAIFGLDTGSLRAYWGQ